MAARKKTPNVSALEQTLQVLTNAGRIDIVDAAAVQALHSIATALDADPANAALWKQYREMLAEVRRADDDANAGLEAALADIRRAAEMGDPPPA